jgi:polar amino acid transport system substrate-binding protein
VKRLTAFFSLTAAAALGLGVLAGPAEPASAQTYKVGIDQTNYEPFAWKDESGNWLGWEVELVFAVCASQGMTCELAPTAWDGIIPALQEGKIDFIFASMTINDERKQQVDFSHWYYDSTVVIIGAKADTTAIDFDNPASVEGKVMGAQGATIHSKFLEARFGSTAEIKTYDGLDNALADLAAGRVDYVQEGLSTLSTFLDSPDGADFEVKATAPADPILGSGVGAAVRKGDAELLAKIDAGIKAVITDGTWDAITAKYPQLDGMLTRPTF